MKTLVFMAMLACAAASAQFPDTSTGRFRGDYFGLLLPVANGCSTERWVMNVTVDEFGEMRGQILNWDGEQKAYIDHRLSGDGNFSFNTGTNFSEIPFPPCFPYCEDQDPGAGWDMRGKANAKAGTLKGFIDARTKGGCKYTFTVWRRFRNN
jgi:hypothetical protein